MSIRLPFFRKKKIKLETLKSDENIPKHVAIIMDGNGRWAKKRGLPRIAGHHEGMKIVKRIVHAASHHKIETLTLYAFSTENWKRPRSEVDFLLRLPKEFLNTYLPDMIKNNVRISTIGNFEELPKHTKKAISEAKEDTKNNDGLELNFALNYGSRNEIVEATKNFATAYSKGEATMEDLENDGFEKYLYTSELRDPDLVIRTSGEKRLSNFLLWQAAYAELWFTDVLWPDFSEEIFKQALSDYQQRKRRYGGI